MAFSYISILKWKRGEQQALTMLDPALRPSVLPLIEILPESVEDDDDDNGNGNVAKKDPFAKVVKQIKSAWGSSAIAVELGLLDSAMVASSGVHPVEHVFSLARASGVLAHPVTGPERDPSYDAAVAKVIAQDQRGACLRLTQDELFEPTLSADVQAAVAAIGATPADIDLLLDWGYVDSAHGRSIAVAAMGVIAQLPSAPWRSITFAASAFPQLLQGVGMGTIPRAEWNIWHRLHSYPANHQLRFGDYAVAHAVYVPTPYPGAANIRYTIDTEWLIVRGRKVTGAAYGGFRQYVGLSQALVADPRYCGPAFSWGDNYISQCAAGTVGTGNMTTWRAVATNHHITFVVRQLANPLGTSTAPVP